MASIAGASAVARRMGFGLRIEDLALGATILIAPRIEALQALLPLLGDSQSAAGGLLALIAVLGATAAMATRVPGEARVESRVKGAEPERLWMIGPFIGAVGFVGGDALGRLGLPGGDALIGVAFLVALASMLLAHRLPVVPRPIRRLLVAPFVLLSGAFFQSLVASAVDGLGGEAGPFIGRLAADEPFLLAYLLALVGMAAGIFYMMLIFVPRELADPGGGTLAWAARFGLFFASLVAATVIGGEVPILFF